MITEGEYPISALSDIVKLGYSIPKICGYSDLNENICTCVPRFFYNNKWTCSKHSDNINKCKNTECSICFENVYNVDSYITKCCGNSFHKECILKWKNKKELTSCPLCRSVIFDDPELHIYPSNRIDPKHLPLDLAAFVIELDYWFCHQLNSYPSNITEFFNISKWIPGILAHITTSHFNTIIKLHSKYKIEC